MERQAVSTESAPAAIGPYSQGIRVGGLLFVSGQIPIDPKVGKIVANTVEEQAHQVLRNLGAILESQGLGFGSLVKTTIFLKSLGDFQAVNRIYAQYVREPFPARATIEVAGLPLDAKVEIEAIACYPKS
ncbi:MAG: RidA family protein [Bdellovibrionales bacterium]|nr:RidA family protein [Bdellovibrionales bacterium]